MKAFSSPTQRMQNKIKERQLSISVVDPRDQKTLQANTKRLFGDINVILRAQIFLSKRLGPKWPELYMELPIEPFRSKEQREHDIMNAKKIQDTNFENRNKLDSESENICVSIKNSDAIIKRKIIYEMESALICLKRWTIFHSKPHVDDLLTALYKIHRKDLAVELEKFVSDGARKWVHTSV